MSSVEVGGNGDMLLGRAPKAIRTDSKRGGPKHGRVVRVANQRQIIISAVKKGPKGYLSTYSMDGQSASNAPKRMRSVYLLLTRPHCPHEGVRFVPSFDTSYRFATAASSVYPRGSNSNRYASPTFLSSTFFLYVGANVGSASSWKPGNAAPVARHAVSCSLSRSACNAAASPCPTACVISRTH